MRCTFCNKDEVVKLNLCQHCIDRLSEQIKETKLRKRPLNTAYGEAGDPWQKKSDNLGFGRFKCQQ